MRIGIIFILSLSIGGCSSYLSSAKKVHRDEVVEEKYRVIDGVYHDSDSHGKSFWKIFISNHRGDTARQDSNASISIKALNSKLLELKYFSNNVLADSAYIDGRFHDSSFYIKSDRKIREWFPLLWVLDTDNNKLNLDSENALQFYNKGTSMVFVIIMPMMAAGNQLERTFKKVK